MKVRTRRVLVLAFAFLLAACSEQAAAPRPSVSPEIRPSPTATPRPTNAANDVIYLRSVASGGVTNILAIDARTGETLRTLADGSLSSDRATLYAPEQISGATETLVHVIDVATSRELRSFTLDGAYRAIWTDSGLTALSRDGSHLALANSPVKIDGDWLTKFAVVDASTGTTNAVFEVKGQSTYGFVAFSPDGRSLYLNQFGEGATKLRVFDVPSATLLPAVTAGGAGLTQNGFRTPGILSPDGRWMFSLDAGSATTNCTSTDGPQCIGNGMPPYVLALDLVSRRMLTLPLPVEQRSGDFEKYLLWSIAIAPDGATAYAINPAIGVIDEIDARQLTLRRAVKIASGRSDPGALAALGQLFFPVAEAKRYITGGAVFSLDGTRIYAAAYNGITVVDAATLGSRIWQKDNREFDALALTADGERLYAVSNASGVISIISTRDGTPLGELKIPAFGQTIVRIDSAR